MQGKIQQLWPYIDSRIVRSQNVPKQKLILVESKFTQVRSKRTHVESKRTHVESKWTHDIYITSICV